MLLPNLRSTPWAQVSSENRELYINSKFQFNQKIQAILDEFDTIANVRSLSAAEEARMGAFDLPEDFSLMWMFMVIKRKERCIYLELNTERTPGDTIDSGNEDTMSVKVRENNTHIVYTPSRARA
ncbi:hypothetical protein H4R34_004941, partial [Dimargaris verticillata]